MKKYYTNSDYNISVYRFMENCGLYCKYKKNIRISHKIMLAKLELRSTIFPESISIPKSVAFGSYSKEDVLSGRIVEVVDDYHKVIAYQNPLMIKKQDLLMNLMKESNKEALSEIRKNILQEQGYVEMNNGEIITQDEYESYYKNEDLEITEKTNRCQSFIYQGGKRLIKKLKIN